MRIFLSYPRERRNIADSLCCELEAMGHEVFFDRQDLPVGETYHARIRESIERSELFIYLLTPNSVRTGRYTRTELKVARECWPSPGRRVLPVMAEPTPYEDIPAYLANLTVLEPEGNLVAEVAMRVAAMVSPSPAPPAKPVVPATDQAQVPRYRSLQIRFGAPAGKSYPLALTASQLGEQDGGGVSLDVSALESMLWAHAEPVTDTARRANPASAPASVLPSAEDARRVGERLHEALFESPLRERLRDGFRTIDPQQGAGLRIVIDTTEAPDLARLPWEFLYSRARDDFLFSDRMKPVVRWLEVDAPPPTLAVEPPLRLLFALAAPSDRAELSMSEELAHLDEALRDLAHSGVVDTRRIEHTTLESLDQALLEHRPHVLHFIGHGDFHGDDGVLVLEAESPGGASDAIAGRQLGVLLRNHLASLRLVYLNSCMGAAVSRHDPFGGVAQSLIRRGIPAVIAMQFPVPDKAAVALARHFYRYLAAGQPVDAALTSARAFLFARGYAVEWGAPALHMRSPDGRLFDLAGAAPATAAPVAASPSATSAAADQDHSASEFEDRLAATEARMRDERTAIASARVEAAPATARHPGAGWILLALGGCVLAVGGWLFFAGQKEVPVEAPGDEPIKIDLDIKIDQQLKDPQPKPPAQSPVVPDPEPAPVDPAPEPEPKPEPDPEPAVPTKGPTPKPPAVSPLEQPLTVGAALLGKGEFEEGLATIEDGLGASSRADLAALTSERKALVLGSLGLTARGSIEAGELELAVRAIRQIEVLEPDEAAREALFGDTLGVFYSGHGTGGVAPGAGQPPLEEYIVRRSDSLWSIAAAQLGNPGLWPSIVAANAESIRDPDRIRVGQRLRLPAHGDPVLPIGYRVRVGDSLWRLAQRFYGDPTAWRAIHAENRGVVADPNVILRGQVLSIPAAASRRQR